jgi:regulator of replication initiation timing
MKKTKRKVNYRYERVSNLSTEIIDSYLVSMFSQSELSKMILENNVLEKSLRYNRIHLKNNTVPHQQLIHDISEQLEHCYDVYNTMMNRIYPEIQQLEENIKREDDYNTLLESKQIYHLYKRMNSLLDNDNLRINKLVCWLRNKPVLHNELENIINNKKEVDIMPKKHTEKRNKNSFGEQFEVLKDLVLSMEEQAKELVNSGSYKEELDHLQTELDIKKKELKMVEKENKGKEKEYIKLQKKYDDLVKSSEAEKKMKEKYQKEVGEIGKTLGETRKELEVVKTDNNKLAKDIKQKENQLSGIEKKIESEWKTKLANKVAIQKIEYQEEMNGLKKSQERSLQLVEALNDELKIINENLVDENKTLKIEIAELKKGLSNFTSSEKINTKPEYEEKDKYETEELSDLFGETDYEPEFS